MKYQIKFPSVDWGGGEIAIEIHCGEGETMTKTGRREQIDICVVSEETNYGERTKNAEFRQVIDVSRVGN